MPVRFKILPDIHLLHELPQDYLLFLDAAPCIQVGPGQPSDLSAIRCHVHQYVLLLFKVRVIL